jgi:hypothetical protein
MRDDDSGGLFADSDDFALYNTSSLAGRCFSSVNKDSILWDSAQSNVLIFRAIEGN